MTAHDDRLSDSINALTDRATRAESRAKQLEARLTAVREALVTQRSDNDGDDVLQRVRAVVGVEQ